MLQEDKHAALMSRRALPPARGGGRQAQTKEDDASSALKDHEENEQQHIHRPVLPERSALPLDCVKTCDVLNGLAKDKR
jgi:hypothetical protein